MESENHTMPCCQGDQRSICALVNALDTIGDKWSLILIRDMMFLHKKEYSEFLASPEGISTNILANRLKGLVESGMATKSKHPSDKKKSLYQLTEKGMGLLPVLIELSLWGNDHLENTFIPEPFLQGMREDRCGFISKVTSDVAKHHCDCDC